MLNSRNILAKNTLSSFYLPQHPKQGVTNAKETESLASIIHRVHSSVIFIRKQVFLCINVSTFSFLLLSSDKVIVELHESISCL